MSKSVATLAPSVRNITKLFRQATAEEVETGAQWYADAFALVSKLAEGYALPPRVVAGIVAALSPLNSWGNNVNLANRFLAAGGLNAGYLGSQLAKARAILDGAPIEETLGGEKTINFYRSILSAGTDGVCIDRHAWSLAVNHRYTEGNIPSLKGKRYAAAVDAYQRAAVILSREAGTAISPAQVQSVTWTLWRRKFWAEGAFDAHDSI